VEALRRFVETGGLPTLTTYKARGVVADSSPSAAGVATGATIEAALLAEADLIIGVGLDPVELIPGPWPYPAPLVLLGRWPIDDSTFFGDRLTEEVVGDLAEILDSLAGDVHANWPTGTATRQRQDACARFSRRRAGVTDRTHPATGRHHRQSHRATDDDRDDRDDRRRGPHAGGRAAVGSRPAR
jgi:thiamine pyrophosphate-dependent acetolactate synthase large subunit-like protein